MLFAAASASALQLFGPLARGALPVRLSPLAAASKMAPELIQRLRLARLNRGQWPERVSLLVRLGAIDSSAAIDALEKRDVLFARGASGAPISRAGWYAASASTAQGLSALNDHPAVERLGAGARAAIRPSVPFIGDFGEVHAITTALEAHARRHGAEQRRSTGHGVVICDVDDGIDPFHPLFFKADGGYYSWFDEDGDGALTPGVDRVDFDRDGAPDGILELLEAGVVDSWSQTMEGVGDGFSAGRDYLFYDVDGDGVRDVGPPSYDDSSPSFGEPFFIADDVDGDGALHPSEKLIGLKTSKIKGIWRVGQGVFERGVNLTEHYGYNDGDHGTGVGGILIGGIFGKTSMTGVAPDAELVVINIYTEQEDDDAQLLEAMEWARDLGASVFIHEYGSHFAEFGDGSSSWEAVLDSFAGEGAAQLAATHNFAGYDGHGAATIGPGESQSVALQTFDVPGFNNYVMGTLRWRGADTDITAQLDMPDGTIIPLTDGEAYFGTWYAGVSVGFSDRGTGMLAFLIAKLNSQQTDFEPLGDSEMLLQIQSAASAATPWRVHISDETGYSYATSVVGVATDVGTMAHPSTADTIISVGAMVGNEVHDGEQDGDLRLYSGRGPRIDGERGVDMIAPSDHFSALHQQGLGDGAPHVGLFGGTSGALPQVGAAVALLRSKEPTLSVADVRQRLRDSAGDDDLTATVPNDEWGYGKLRIHALLFGDEPAANAWPVARATSKMAHVGHEVELNAADSSDADADAGALIFRWDLNYDGAWDIVTQGEPVVAATFDAIGAHIVKLEVEDELGYGDQVLLPVTVVEAPPIEPEPEPEPGLDSAPQEQAGPQGPPDASSSPSPQELVAPSPARETGCSGGAPVGPLGSLYLLLWIGLCVRLTRSRTLG